MSRARIAINVDESSATLDDILRLIAGDPAKSIQNLAAYLSAIAGGSRNGSVRVTTNAVKASLVGTFTDNPANGETCVINGVTFTAVTSGATANQWNIVSGGSAAADAAGNASAMAAAINASTSAKIKNIITATASGATITLTCNVPGTIGNLCTVTDSLANFSWAGAATALDGGTEGTEVICNHGLDV